MKKTMIEKRQKRIMKIVLMQKLGNEFNKTIQNKALIKLFPKIEKFSDEYIHEVEKTLLVDTVNTKIRKEK